MREKKRDLGVTLSHISALIESARLESKMFDGRRMVSIASVEKCTASLLKD